MRFTLSRVLLLTAALAVSNQVLATPFQYIRIGDRDGFGFNNDSNLASLTGDGGLADRNGNGQLFAGDVLPSLNGNAIVAFNNGDDFDNRLAESITGTGFADTGSTGQLYTDISLSRSYDANSAAGTIYNANTSSYGTGGSFPDPNSNVLTNQPGFVFDFLVAAGDISVGNPIFFNMLFGDYDVAPANITFHFASGNQTLNVSPQNSGPDDGLIQGAFASLAFNDVFTFDVGTSSWLGYVAVDFVAPNEPYTAFDYVELSLAPFAVPEPTSLLLLLSGLAGILRKRWCQKLFISADRIKALSSNHSHQTTTIKPLSSGLMGNFLKGLY